MFPDNSSSILSSAFAGIIIFPNRFVYIYVCVCTCVYIFYTHVFPLSDITSLRSIPFKHSCSNKTETKCEYARLYAFLFDQGKRNGCVGEKR